MIRGQLRITSRSAPSTWAVVATGRREFPNQVKPSALVSCVGPAAADAAVAMASDVMVSLCCGWRWVAAMTPTLDARLWWTVCTGFASGQS